MGGKRPFLIQDDEQFIKDWNTKATLKDLSWKYMIRIPTLRRHAARLGLPPKPDMRKKENKKHG